MMEDITFRQKISLIITTTAEEILESDSESSGSEEENVTLTISCLKMGNYDKRKPVRITLYMEEVVARYNQIEFQRHFRMSREAYEMLLHRIGPTLKRNGNIGRYTVSVEKQILAVLWLLATPDSYRSVGERFDLSKSSLSVTFMRVVKALNKLAPNIIRWPQEEEFPDIERSFFRMGKIPSVIGAIDGTYIPIKAPLVDSEVYITRKCFYAITLQAICIGNLKFSNVFVGYPGSVSDTRIFKNSDIYQEVTINHEQYFPNNQHLLGDKAYPTLPWVIPPFINRGQLTPAQVYFNGKHAQTRQCIERAFALLFGRFRRLRYLDMNRFDMIPHTVLAACVLHNVCLEHRDLLLNEYIADGQNHVQHNDEFDEVGRVRVEEELTMGRMKRMQLCRNVYIQVNL